MTAAKEAQGSLDELQAKLESGPISTFLGMRLVELAPGRARVVMKMRPEYENFNKSVFGGIIMALADHAFACGANSMGHLNVASQFNIHFIAAAACQDELTAECRVMHRGKRVNVVEIMVTNQYEKLIARATATAIPMT